MLRYFVNFKKPHPLKKDMAGNPAGTIVDYNIALILVPTIIVGSAVGVVVNYILPEPIQIGIQFVCLLAILGTTAPKLY